MTRDLGTISFDDYLRVTGQEAGSPHHRNRRFRGRMLSAFVLAGCVVMSFAAGMTMQPEGKGRTDRATGQLATGISDWPTAGWAQQKLVVAGMRDALACVQFLRSVALEREVDRAPIRDHALVALRNIAEASVQGLDLADHAGLEIAPSLLEDVRSRLPEPK